MRSTADTPQDFISLDDARRMVAAAVRRAEQLGVDVTIIVSDATGELVTERRMAGAWRDAGDIALAKAFIASSFDLETWRLEDEQHPATVLLDETLTVHQRVFAGGIPVHRGATVIGAVGVSGAAADDDHACAEAAVLARRFVHA